MHIYETISFICLLDHLVASTVNNSVCTTGVEPICSIFFLFRLSLIRLVWRAKKKMPLKIYYCEQNQQKKMYLSLLFLVSFRALTFVFRALFFSSSFCHAVVFLYVRRNIKNQFILSRKRKKNARRYNDMWTFMMT